MGTDNILSRMALYDFKTPINTILYEGNSEDEDNSIPDTVTIEHNDDNNYNITLDEKFLEKETKNIKHTIKDEIKQEEINKCTFPNCNIFENGDNRFSILLNKTFKEKEKEKEANYLMFKHSKNFEINTQLNFSENNKCLEETNKKRKSNDQIYNEQTNGNKNYRQNTENKNTDVLINKVLTQNIKHTVNKYDSTSSKRYAELSKLLLSNNTSKNINKNGKPNNIVHRNQDEHNCKKIENSQQTNNMHLPPAEVNSNKIIFSDLNSIWSVLNQNDSDITIDPLNTISLYLILIAIAYNFHLGFQNSNKICQKAIDTRKKHYLKIKYELFKEVYDTFYTNIIPQEKDYTFNNQFLNSTISLANNINRYNLNTVHCHKIINNLFIEMFKWVKQRKRLDLKTPEVVQKNNATLKSVLLEILSQPPKTMPNNISQNPERNLQNDSTNDMSCIFSSGEPGREICISIDNSLLVNGNGALDKSNKNVHGQNTNVNKPQNLLPLEQLQSQCDNFNNTCRQDSNVQKNSVMANSAFKNSPSNVHCQNTRIKIPENVLPPQQMQLPNQSITNVPKDLDNLSTSTNIYQQVLHPNKNTLLANTNVGSPTSESLQLHAQSTNVNKPQNVLLRQQLQCHGFNCETPKNMNRLSADTNTYQRDLYQEKNTLDNLNNALINSELNIRAQKTAINRPQHLLPHQQLQSQNHTSPLNNTNNALSNSESNMYDQRTKVKRPQNLLPPQQLPYTCHNFNNDTPKDLNNLPAITHRQSLDSNGNQIITNTRSNVITTQNVNCAACDYYKSKNNETQLTGANNGHPHNQPHKDMEVTRTTKRKIELTSNELSTNQYWNANNARDVSIVNTNRMPKQFNQTEYTGTYNYVEQHTPGQNRNSSLHNVTSNNLASKSEWVASVCENWNQNVDQRKEGNFQMTMSPYNNQELLLPPPPRYNSSRQAQSAHTLQFSTHPPPPYHYTPQSKRQAPSAQTVPSSNEQPESYLTRSSVSTDSGFTSPIEYGNTNNPVEDIMKNLMEPEQTLYLPSITHVTSLHPDAMYIQAGRCYVCGKPCKEMCSVCYKIYYCSPECQQLDWRSHMLTCGNRNIHR